VSAPPPFSLSLPSSLPLSFLASWLSWNEERLLLCSCHDALPHHRPKAMWPNRHTLKPLKPWAQINLTPFRLIISDILSQQQEVD
jgi:hypothetical protein